MNETVKGILRLSRTEAQQAVRGAEIALQRAQQQALWKGQQLAQARHELADLDAALTEAGVDLAAEDAKAAERASHQGMSQACNLSQSYGQAMSDGVLGGNYASALGGVNGQRQ